ncbi:MAG: hypothetical protein QG656_2527 [Candidatus Hydrogenedentes bacterium]|nr:hypothetical protein [Candidatus Hydrogenedentota bacterium]
MRPWLRNAVIMTAVFLVSLTLLLLGFEAVLRFQAHRLDERRFETMMSLQEKDAPPEGNFDSVTGILRLSKNEGRILELIPNMSVTFKGAPVVTNAEGFRGPLQPHAKPPGTVRIVGIGDSVMFGWGVREDESYLALLEQRLNAEFPAVRWETVNLAVPDYNTVMEVETFKDKGLAYEPDLVVTGFVRNDLCPPNLIRKRIDCWTLRKSFVVDYVTEGIARRKHMADVGGGMIVAPWSGVPAYFEDRIHEVPDEYRAIYGVEAYRRAMKELTYLAKMHRFSLLVVAHSGILPEAQTVLNELGTEVVDNTSNKIAYLAEHNLGSDESSLHLSNDDPHPSPRGHRLFAETIFDAFVQRGIVRELVAKHAVVR